MNKDLHRKIMVEILGDIYRQPKLRTILGFKGGTAAMLFYDLPRFSVDLDFDLLDESKKTQVMEEVGKIVKNYGEVKEAREKRYTLFHLLSYGKGERGLKVEISKRPTRSDFESLNYLGSSMLVMNKPDMMACKLSALATRKRLAVRDMYDMWFFLKQHWEMNGKLILEKTGKSEGEIIEITERRSEGVLKNKLLSGLGELLDEKQKAWVREHLQEELLFLLRLMKKSRSDEI